MTRPLQYVTGHDLPDGRRTVAVLGTPHLTKPFAILPTIVRGPAYPITVYAPSRVHDCYEVTYGHHWPSSSRWIVPGTMRCDQAPPASEDAA